MESELDKLVGIIVAVLLVVVLLIAVNAARGEWRVVAAGVLAAGGLTLAVGALPLIRDR